MQRRVSRARNVARMLVVGLAMAIATWRIVMIGFSDFASAGGLSAALDWHEGQPRALIEAAVEQRQEGKTATAHDYAVAAIQANPLDGQGYRELALSEQIAHPGSSAVEPLMRIASRLAPRDRMSHRWLLEFDLATQRHASALVHLDFLLRLPADNYAFYFMTLAGLLDKPASQPDVIALLAQDVPWRGAFWTALTRGSTPVSTIAKAVAALDQGKTPLDTAERRMWQDRLIRDQSWELARAYWQARLPTTDGAENAVHDGGFEHQDEAESIFDWQFRSIAGATISQPVDSTASGGGRTLQISFRDRRVPFAHVSQTLLLSAGSYVLDGRRKMRRLRSDRGLQWTLTCVEPPYVRIAETDLFRGDDDWSEFSVDFTVPGEHCPAQRLTLALAARVPAEQRIDGTIWFDDLSVRTVK